VRFKIRSHDFLFILIFLAAVIFGFEFAFAGAIEANGNTKKRVRTTARVFFEKFTGR
jgi:hypothetical protein